MVTPRSQRLTISKLVPTSSANFAWDHPLRLRACLKRSFGTCSSTVMMEAPSSQLVPISLVSFPPHRKDYGTDGTVMKNYPAGENAYMKEDNSLLFPPRRSHYISTAR